MLGLGNFSNVKMDARIEIKPSLIVNAGLGVFAKIDMPAETFLDYYKGQIVDIDKPGGTAASDKLMTIKKKPPWWPADLPFGNSAIINGAVNGNWITMINHSSSPNIDFDQAGKFYTIRPIETGEELLVDYGYEYWRHGPIQLC